MKKYFISILLGFCFCNTTYAESYFFKECKINDSVMGNYIINIEKNVIEVELKNQDGMTQNFSDKIKSIEADKITSEQIKSAKGEKIYYQYFLNSKPKSIIKLEYKKESGYDGDVFKLKQKNIGYCADVKADWDKDKIDKAKASKEEKEIRKAKEELKKEQESIYECQGDDFNNWTNCKGSYEATTGHKYNGIFIDGKILKGISIYPGGAKYIGEFKNFKPDGYGTFSWTNGDRYYGQWKDGKNNGTGTKLWSDGTEYSGMFKSDKLHGEGTFYYSDGKKYVGEFINGKRHGKGIFTYPDGTAFVGQFIAGKQQGLGECIAVDGSSVPCQSKTDTQTQDFSGKDTSNISIVAKKWVRVSQYENNSKRGKKIMDKLKNDFEIEAKEICNQKSYTVLDKKIEILDVDETPAYGLETKLKIGINGVIECN
tara:strand:+ start:75 stop:1355 length:1281 start_codon:yes stop_codon:yes gene_type:complete